MDEIVKSWIGKILKKSDLIKFSEEIMQVLGDCRDEKRTDRGPMGIQILKPKLKEFGYNFGMAFQIRDDLINIKNIDKLKPSQNDIESGIFNAPVIFAGQTTDLTDGFAKTETLLNNYIEKARETISNLKESTYKQALYELLGILNNGKI